MGWMRNIYDKYNKYILLYTKIAARKQPIFSIFEKNKPSSG